MVDESGFDSLGYADQENLDGQREAIGAFQFSRPEDIHANPYNGSQALFASTGGVSGLLAQGEAFDDADIWGVTYLDDVKLNKGSLRGGAVAGNLRVVYDGDDLVDEDNPRPSFGEHPGLRSPDNLCWASDHKAYIQEDRTTGFYIPEDIFNLAGEEASVWQVHPHSGASLRVAQMNRQAILPDGQEDGVFSGIPLQFLLGAWESSGIIDVSDTFGEKKGGLFLLNVQAHGTTGGAITSENLVEGGQILFLKKD